MYKQPIINCDVENNNQLSTNILLNLKQIVYKDKIIKCSYEYNNFDYI